MGIKVLPPDVNVSKGMFTISDIEENAIRFGFTPIKNLGKAPANAIIKERDKGLFKGLLDFCERVDLNKVNSLKVKSLIEAGAFDSFGYTRASMLEWVDLYWEFKDKYKAYESKLATYNKKLNEYYERLEEIKATGGYRLNEDGKKVKINPKKKPIGSIAPGVPQIPFKKELPILELFKREYELLGLYVSGHPLDTAINPESVKGVSVEELKDLNNGEFVRIIAIVVANKEHTVARNKKKMAFLTLEDLTGRIEATVFPGSYEKVKEFLELSNLPLQIDAKTEIIETDEGDNIVKLIINDIEIARSKKEKREDKLFVVETEVENLNKIEDIISDKKTDYRMLLIAKFKSGVELRIPQFINIKSNKRKVMEMLGIEK